MSRCPATDLAKVDRITTVSPVPSVIRPFALPLRWATASNERALANARAATTECSRRRLERAEVERFLATLPAVPPQEAGHPSYVGLIGR